MFVFVNQLELPLFYSMPLMSNFYVSSYFGLEQQIGEERGLKVMWDIFNEFFKKIEYMYMTNF